MKISSAALLLSVLRAVEVVNGQAINTNGLTTCAAGCVTEAIDASTCSADDQSCICSTTYEYSIDESLGYCLGSNCPEPDWDPAIDAFVDYCEGSVVSATGVGTDIPITYTAAGSVTTATIGGAFTTPISGGSSNTFYPSKKSGLSTGAKVGIAIGVILIVLLLAVGAVLFLCMRKRRTTPIAAGTDAVAADALANGTPYTSPGQNMAMPAGQMGEKGYSVVTSQAVPPAASEGYHYVDQNGNPVQMAFAPTSAPDMMQQQGIYPPGAMWGVPAGATTQAYYNVPLAQSPPPQAPVQSYQPPTSPQPVGPPPPGPHPAGPPGASPEVREAHLGAAELSHDSASNLSPLSGQNTGGSPGSLLAAGQAQVATQQGGQHVVPGQVYELGTQEGHAIAPGPHPGTQHVVAPENGGGSGPVELA